MIETPIVMIAYNRPDLVRLTIKNVSLAERVRERDIFMFIDGPRNDADALKQNEIFEIVSSYQAELPRMQIIRRERNYGCRGNIVDAISRVINQYGQAMIIEDDILISRTFVTYMDNALDFYRDDKSIWSINAYQNPNLRIPKNYPADIYRDPVNMCWGWGTWKDRWEKVDFDLKDWEERRSDKELICKLNHAGRQIVPMIELQHAGKLKTWDIQCTYHAVKNGLMSIEPRYQLSKNIGFLNNNTSEHCSGNRPYITHQKYYNFRPRLTRVIVNDDALTRQFEWAYVPMNFWSRVVRKIRRVLAHFTPQNMDPIDMVDVK